MRELIDEARGLLEAIPGPKAKFPDPPLPVKDWDKARYRDQYRRPLSKSKWAKAQWAKGVAYGRKWLTNPKNVMGQGQSSMETARHMMQGGMPIDKVAKMGVLGGAIAPERESAQMLRNHAHSEQEGYGNAYSPFWGGAYAVGKAVEDWWMDNQGKRSKDWVKALRKKLAKEFGQDA